LNSCHRRFVAVDVRNNLDVVITITGLVRIVSSVLIRRARVDSCLRRV
jgi:hypothetical protein